MTLNNVVYAYVDKVVSFTETVPYRPSSYWSVINVDFILLCSMLFVNKNIFLMLQELSGFTYFLLGALAKMVATVITYPLQVIQSRLRVRT